MLLSLLEVYMEMLRESDYRVIAELQHGASSYGTVKKLNDMLDALHRVEKHLIKCLVDEAEGHD